MEKQCLECGKKYKIFPCEVKINKYCSAKCRDVHRGKNMGGDKNPAWRGGINSPEKIKRCCEVCQKEFVIKRNRSKTAKYCSKACYGKIISEWLRGIKRPYMTGKNNPSWKGGITPINTKIRESMEYKEWRKNVFEKDNYICQICGERGGILHADHIKPFSLFIELRFELDNGRTLCKKCHLKTDTWGGRVCTYADNCPKAH